MKYSSKGHKDLNIHKNRIKRSGQARLIYVKDTNRNIPPREGEPAGTEEDEGKENGGGGGKRRTRMRAAAATTTRNRTKTGRTS